MNTALILSGGTGSRLGNKIPKQYLMVANRMVISYCLDTILKSPYIDAVQIVADIKWHEAILDSCNYPDESYISKIKGFSLPGSNRQLSIYNGLEDISEYSVESDYVLIHDAARPFLSQDLIKRSFEALKQHDGVMPVLTMKDTVYLSEDGKHISSLLNRNHVYSGQAPESFVLGKYLEANRKLLPDGILNINGTSEPAIISGMDVTMIEGDENNFKITTKDDLKRFESMINGICER